MYMYMPLEVLPSAYPVWWIKIVLERHAFNTWEYIKGILLNHIGPRYPSQQIDLVEAKVSGAVVTKDNTLCNLIKSGGATRKVNYASGGSLHQTWSIWHGASSPKPRELGVFLKREQGWPAADKEQVGLLSKVSMGCGPKVSVSISRMLYYWCFY